MNLWNCGESSPLPPLEADLEGIVTEAGTRCRGIQDKDTLHGTWLFVSIRPTTVPRKDGHQLLVDIHACYRHTHALLVGIPQEHPHPS